MIVAVVPRRMLSSLRALLSTRLNWTCSLRRLSPESEADSPRRLNSVRCASPLSISSAASSSDSARRSPALNPLADRPDPGRARQLGREGAQHVRRSIYGASASGRIVVSVTSGPGLAQALIRPSRCYRNSAWRRNVWKRRLRSVSSLSQARRTGMSFPLEASRAAASSRVRSMHSPSMVPSKRYKTMLI